MAVAGVATAFLPLFSSPAQSDRHMFNANYTYNNYFISSMKTAVIKFAEMLQKFILGISFVVTVHLFMLFQ